MLNDAPSFYFWIQVTLYISAKFVSKTIKGVNVRYTWYTLSLWQAIKLKTRNNSGEKNPNCRSHMTTLHFSLIQKRVHLNFKFTNKHTHLPLKWMKFTNKLNKERLSQSYVYKYIIYCREQTISISPTRMNSYTTQTTH